jgi:hypothetical protein
MANRNPYLADEVAKAEKIDHVGIGKYRREPIGGYVPQTTGNEQDGTL